MDRTLRHIRAFKRISETIGTSGQPTEEQFSDIKSAGYEAVINLVPTEQHSVPKESEIVTALGMDYVHIPVIWTQPTRANLDAFFSEMDKRVGTPVLVHCAANMRVSAFMFAYRVVRCGVDRDEAEEDLYDFWLPEGRWADLLDGVIEEFEVG